MDAQDLLKIAASITLQMGKTKSNKIGNRIGKQIETVANRNKKAVEAATGVATVLGSIAKGVGEVVAATMLLAK